MIAFTIIAAFVVYLAVSCVVVWLVIRWARRTGRGVKGWAAGAILVMYLLVFWDHIPTLVLYKYYCNTKAGFWVRKTPEQWKAENPGVAETLHRSNSKSFRNSDGSWGFDLNERFIWLHEIEKNPIFPVRIDYESIIDVKNKEKMVERINVGAGYEGEMQLYRFWTYINAYTPNQKQFESYITTFGNLGGK